MELTSFLSGLASGLYMGGFIMLFPILYLYDKWRNAEKDYEEFKRMALREIYELKTKGGKQQ